MTLPPSESTNHDATPALKELLDVIDALLAESGCPWDRKQSPRSLCDYVIEEAFELVEAVRADAGAGRSAVDLETTKQSHPEAPTPETADALEELGDVLFLLLFISKLYERAGSFTLAESLRGNAAKMIRRHPHVFDKASFDTEEDLLVNWERIKRAEKKTDEPAGFFDSLPKGLPPMLKAYRLHAKAARIGFTWDSDADLKRQLDDEEREFAEAVASGDKERMEDEYGDYLFTLIEYGRRLGLKANAALDGANMKFLHRFRAMEKLAREEELSLPDLRLEEMNELWDRVKADE